MAKRLIPQEALQMQVKLLEILQSGSHERISEFLKAVMNTPGVALSPTSSGAIPQTIEVRNAAGYNIYVTAGYAIDSSGNIIVVPTDTDTYEVLAGGPYLALLTFATNHYETGTVEVTYDAVEATGYENKITGDGTAFTDNFNVGMWVKICDSAMTNNGIYSIIRIDSDEVMCVARYRDGEVVPYSFVDEDELRFEAVGMYPTGYPASGDKRCYRIGSYSIEIRDEALGYTEGTEIVVGRVRRTGTTVEITDLRHWNVFSLNGNLTGEIGEYLLPVAPAHVIVTTGSFDPYLPALADPVTGLMFNAYIDVEWGHTCPIDSSSKSYIGSRWRMADSSVAGTAEWTADLWSDAEHVLIDSENSVHKIVDSGANWVETDTEPAAGEFWITPNAESYVVVIEKVTTVDGVSESSIEDSHHEIYASSPVRMTYRYKNAHSGHLYSAKVCALKNGFRSAYTTGYPNPKTAGFGAPSILPELSLTRPLTLPSSGLVYDGLLELNITNHAACIAPPGTDDVASVGFELYVSQGAEDDFPGINASSYRATITGQRYRFTPEGMSGSAANFCNITVVPFSASGMRGTPVNASIGAGLSATIFEEWESRPPLERPTPDEVMDAIEATIALIGGAPSTVSTVINNMISAAICDCQKTCCTGSAAAAATTEDTSSYFDRQHYINLTWPGALVADRTFLETALGDRYAINVNKLRLHNVTPGSGSAILRLFSAVSSDEIALGAGEYEADYGAFGLVSKAVADNISLRSLTAELLNPDIRIGFKISEWGKFADAGESTDVHYETLFDTRGGVVAGQELDNTGVDYDGTFTIDFSEVVVQKAPDGGGTDGLVIHIGDKLGDSGNYIEIKVAEDGLSKSSSTNLVVGNPHQLYARVIGDPHNAAYVRINCRILQNGLVSGTYPYDYEPHFDAYNFHGADAGSVQRPIRTFPYAMSVPWCEIHLPQGSPTDCRFRISGVSPTASGSIEILVPASTGYSHNDNTGSITIQSMGMLYIEVLDGNPSDYILLWEGHRVSS